MRAGVLAVVATLALAPAGRAAGVECVRFYGPGSGGPARSVAVSPDGRLVAVADGSRRVAVHDARTGAEAAEVTDPEAGFRVIGFTPDGTRLVGGLSDGRVVAWAVEGWQQVAAWGRHAGPVTCLAFSADGRRAATGGDDRAVVVNDVATGRPLRTLEGHTKPVRGVGLTPDGAAVVSAGDDEVRVWDAVTGRQTAALRDEDGPGGGAVAISPDGRSAVVGHASRYRGAVWDLASGKAVARLGGADGVWAAARFTAGGNAVTAAAADGTVRTWDAATGKETGCRRGHPKAVLCWSESTDGRRAASGGAGGEVVVWDGDRAAGFLRTHESALWALGFTPDGRWLTASVSAPGGSQVWRSWPLAAGGAMTDEKLGGRMTNVSHQAMSKTGAVRVRAYGPDILVDRKKTDGSWGAGTWLKADYDVRGLDLSDDGRTLVTVDKQSKAVLSVWDTDRGVRERTVALGEWVDGPENGLALTADGATAAVSVRGEIAVIDVAAGRLVTRQRPRVVGPDGTVISSPSVFGLRFTPDRQLALAAGDSFQVWDPATGRPRLALPSSKQFSIRHLAVGPGNLVAAAGAVSTASSLQYVVQVVRVGQGPRPLELVGEVVTGAEVTALAFAPDGSAVATADSRYWVRVWGLPGVAGGAGARPPATPAARKPDPLDEQKVKALLAEFDNPNASRQTQMQAVQKIGQLGPAAATAVPVLVERLKKTPDDRAVLVWVLGEIGAEAVGPLGELVADPHPAVGLAAAVALGKLGRAARPAGKALLAALAAEAGAYSQNARTQQERTWIEWRNQRLATIVDILPAVGADPAEAVPALAKLAATPIARRGSLADLHRQAVRSLKAYGPDAKAAVPVLTEVAKEALLTDPRLHFLCHAEAIEALGAIGPDAAAAVPVLRQILQANTDRARGAHRDVENALRLIQPKG